MAGPPGAEALTDGWRALDRADWETARSVFAAAVPDGDAGEARDGLSQALWFLGRVAEAIALRERAFEDLVRAGRCDDAVRVAVWVAHQHALGGRASAGRGWLARAERALDGRPPGAGAGWVAVERARQAERVAEQVAAATRALDAARTLGHRGLEVLAVSLLGWAQVRAGRREEGLRLLEEAMAAATAGRVRDVHTLGEAYCTLVLACSAAGEWERAAEWCELVDTFARTHAAAPLHGACRTVHAGVLLATGRWADAEAALWAALATHVRYVPEMSAPAIACLAELRVLQGRLPEAEELLADREEHPASLRALALLRLADGRPGQAVRALDRGLRDTGDDAVATAPLLATLVDARLDLGDVAGAAAAADDLARLASTARIRLLTAHADLAAAHVALAAGPSAAAIEPSCRALAGYSTLRMPLEAGRARLALARAVAADDPGTAADEVRTALAAFRRLGAARAVDAATALLRRLDGDAGRRPPALGGLTGREVEVLGLVARGLSNAAIARTLVISERTAGHHVSHILEKLGVRNRAEAAAYAVRAVRE